MTTTINASNSGSGGLVQTADASGVLALQTAGTTAVTIDTSQRVGIGTTSPNFQVSFGANIGKTLAVFENAGTSVYGIGMGGAGTAGDPYRTKLFSNGTENASITDAGVFSFNSGYGSVGKAYGCRAWVNFNGTGTPAIRASGNVSSITDNGTGDYTVNFTTAMPDANYSFSLSLQRISTGSQANQNIVPTINDGAGNVASSSLRVRAYASPANTSFDVDIFTVAIFR